MSVEHTSLIKYAQKFGMPRLVSFELLPGLARQHIPDYAHSDRPAHHALPSPACRAHLTVIDDCGGGLLGIEHERPM